MLFITTLLHYYIECTLQTQLHMIDGFLFPFSRNVGRGGGMEEIDISEK